MNTATNPHPTTTEPAPQFMPGFDWANPVSPFAGSSTHPLPDDGDETPGQSAKRIGDASAADYSPEGERVLTDGQKAQLAALMDEYVTLKNERDEAAKALEATRSMIEDLLGDEEFKGDTDDDLPAKIAYTFPKPRRSLDKKAFEKAHPTLAKAYADAAEPFYKEGERKPRLTID